jgi:hypothetical protein
MAVGEFSNLCLHQDHSSVREVMGLQVFVTSLRNYCHFVYEKCPNCIRAMFQWKKLIYIGQNMLLINSQTHKVSCTRLETFLL